MRSICLFCSEPGENRHTAGGQKKGDPAEDGWICDQDSLARPSIQAPHFLVSLLAELYHILYITVFLNHHNNVNYRVTTGFSMKTEKAGGIPPATVEKIRSWLRRCHGRPGQRLWQPPGRHGDRKRQAGRISDSARQQTPGQPKHRTQPASSLR